MPYPGGPPGDVDLYNKPNLVPGCFATGLPADVNAGHLSLISKASVVTRVILEAVQATG